MIYYILLNVIKDLLKIVHIIIMASGVHESPKLFNKDQIDVYLIVSNEIINIIFVIFFFLNPRPFYVFFFFFQQRFY